MKKIFVFVFLFFILFTTGCTWSKQFVDVGPKTSEYAPQIRVLSYNIHYGYGTDGRLNLKRIAEVINSVNPDIVALQEVERSRPRTLLVDQAAKIARLTGFTAVYGPNITYGYGLGGKYGNAVLTRFPVISHKNYLIPRTRGSQRGVLDVELAIPQEYGFDNNLVLHVFDTHLEPGVKRKIERAVSAGFIEALVQPMLGNPMILAGDFNDVPESRTMSLFRNIWEIADYGKALITGPSVVPQKQIDQVLFHPKDRWKVIEVRVIDEKVASDHRPILAVLEWIGNKKDDS